MKTKKITGIFLSLLLVLTMLPLTVLAADTTYTVTLAVNRTDLGSVSGDGEYANGDTVTLTATVKYDNVFFAYWLDSSVTLSEEPTAAELEAAIVSYDSTYTFTAAKDISLTAVFAYNSSIGVNGMYYANEDEIFSGEGSGTNIEEIATTTEIGKQSVTISVSDYDEYVTIDDVVYERNCMFTWTYDQTTEQIVYTTHDSLSIPVAPVYDSVEYWAYLAEYEAPVTVAYVPHTHSYTDATCTEAAVCDCSATTGSVDSTNHTGGTEVRNQKDATEFEDGYTGDTYCLGCNTMIEQGEVISATHTHSYSAATCTTPATCSCGATTGGVDSTNHTYDEDGYQKDANGHWQLCSNENCPDADKGKTASTPHTYDGDTDAVCDTCNYTRLILVADKTVVSGNGTVTLTSSLPVIKLVCSNERYKDYISGSGQNWSFQMKNNVTTDLTFTVTSGSQTASCTVSFVQDPDTLILTPSSTTLVGSGTITLTGNKDITGITCSNQSYETDISGSGQIGNSL